jgi:hypothetical protein
VHVFRKDGGAHRKKAPANIFTETDLYTIKRADGSRDLRLEHGLSQLETAFSAIRTEFLRTRRQLPTVRKLKLMAFVAALHSRTPVIRDHHMKFWNEVQQAGEYLERQMKTETPEKLEALGTAPPGGGPSMSMDDVRWITASPMEHTLPAYFEAELPYLVQMQTIILCSKSKPGFITSDAPVVWFDPEWHKKPPIWRSPSFSTALLEISVPISPEQMLVITHQGQHNPSYQTQYIDVLEHHVAELNRRTRFCCDKEFVVNREVTHLRWFDRGTVPPDAWEMQHGVEDPLAQ